MTAHWQTTVHFRSGDHQHRQHALRRQQPGLEEQTAARTSTDMSKIIKKIIKTPLAAAPVAPYNQAVVAGNTVYCSGMLGVNKDTMQLVPGGTVAQAREAFINLRHVLEASGSSFEKVVKMTVLLQNLDDFKDVNEVYKEFFKQPYPARTAYQVARLPMNAAIEMEAVALVGEVQIVE
ncbi:rutC family protein UK114 [Thrips palmi]|uniref:RutC family protein UK114 n=1 Tax=Thrips palmi TaxID=161013 RepID=A0A6P8YTJ4_THRPL|nr:rutC family protein UK114 [Thrips palmi]